MKLKNKNVLITGASAGIGEACAKAFAAEGANLILTARRKERLDNLAKELINNHKVNVLTLQLDVRFFDNVKEQLSDLPDEFNEIDILINNAGKALGTEKIQDGVLDN
jgi:NADP-dependent 3-hydroxy acid dehydrogenase YdfG